MNKAQNYVMELAIAQNDMSETVKMGRTVSSFALGIVIRRHMLARNRTNLRIFYTSFCTGFIYALLYVVVYEKYASRRKTKQFISDISDMLNSDLFSTPTS